MGLASSRERLSQDVEKHGIQEKRFQHGRPAKGAPQTSTQWAHVACHGPSRLEQEDGGPQKGGPEKLFEVFENFSSAFDD